MILLDLLLKVLIKVTFSLKETEMKSFIFLNFEYFSLFIQQMN